MIDTIYAQSDFVLHLMRPNRGVHHIIHHIVSYRIVSYHIKWQWFNTRRLSREPCARTFQHNHKFTIKSPFLFEIYVCYWNGTHIIKRKKLIIHHSKWQQWMNTLNHLNSIIKWSSDTDWYAGASSSSGIIELKRKKVNGFWLCIALIENSIEVCAQTKTSPKMLEQFVKFLRL